MIGSHAHVDSARSYALRYASPRASSACTPSSSRTAPHGRAAQMGRAGQGSAQLCRYGLTQPERRYHAEVVRVVAHVHDQIDPLLGAVGREVSHRVVPRVAHVTVHADPRWSALCEHAALAQYQPAQPSLGASHSADGMGGRRRPGGALGTRATGSSCSRRLRSSPAIAAQHEIEYRKGRVLGEYPTLRAAVLTLYCTVAPSARSVSRTNERT